MHAINGYVYCNGPTLQLEQGEKLRLVVMGFGSEVDMHSAVFSGQSVSRQGERRGRRGVRTSDAGSGGRGAGSAEANTNATQTHTNTQTHTHTHK